MIGFIKDFSDGLKNLKTHIADFKDLSTGIKMECKNVGRNVAVNGVALDVLKPAQKS